MTDVASARRTRREQVAEYAREARLDGVLIHSWHRQSVAWLTGYAPGYVTNQATLWIGADGTCRLGVRFPFDAERAATVSGLPAVPLARAAQLVPSGAARIGLVAGDAAVDETTPALLADLAAAGTAHVDLRDWLDELQETKLPAEIDALRRAGEVAAAALQVWGDEAPVGRTDAEVAAEIEAVARRAGARRALCLIGIGPGAVVTECVGRTIGAADPVGLEFTMYLDEWCMHVNRQLHTVDDDADARAAQAVCAAARATMLREMAAGMPVDDVVGLGDDVLAAAGMLDAKEYDFGHGLAADTPAHPRLVPGTGRRLALNSVLALHVAVRVPGGPTGFVGGPVLLRAAGAVELNPAAPWAVETGAAAVGVD